MRLKTFVVAAALAVASLSSACAMGGSQGGAMERSGLAIGTVCSIRIVDGGSQRALDEAFARLVAIENVMSANKDGTVVDALNKAAGGAPIKVPADLMAVLQRSLLYAELSGGAFDPTIGPLVKLWGIGGDNERVPEPAEIGAALRLIDHRGLTLDTRAGTAALARPGMRVDLGAIAKGYAADEVARILKDRGVKAAIVDLGGNIMAVGKKPDGSPWRIGVQDPFDQRGAYIGLASVPGGTTVVTSGIYERYFTGPAGEHYHHILDVKTGYPVVSDLVSVTIIASSSMDADGLSTAAFALGLERGMALIESRKEVEAVFIDSSRRVYLSSGAKAIFRLTDQNFTLAN